VAGSSVRRLASTQPAAPAPTMTKSNFGISDVKSQIELPRECPRLSRRCRCVSTLRSAVPRSRIVEEETVARPARSQAQRQRE